jgi:hypothetical protein
LRRQRDILESTHPWQLWTNNLGRIAADLRELDAAAEFFNKSLDLCRNEDHRPTVQVMALLPLAGLHHIGRRPDDMKGNMRMVRQAAQELNPAYFKMVLEKDVGDVLEEIWNRPEIFFPFSYR